MADKKISELTPLSGALNVADALPISDDSASQTKKINPKNLIEQGVLLIADNSIPIAKIDNTGGIPAGAVGTTELADGAVTAIKLANNSSGVVGAALPASGVRVGQVALETTTGKFYCWDGSQWAAVKAGGSVNTITPITGGLLQIQINQTGDEVEILCVFNDTASPREFIAGPTASGGAVTARQIIGDDLPTASAIEKGAIEVSGNGLAMDGDTLKIDNNVTPSNGNFNLADVDANGLVVAYKPIESADLPVASDALPGAISPGIDLAVDSMGRLNHISKAPAGTYTKITTDEQGHCLNGEQLTADDVPDLPADKITSGTLAEAVIGDKSITRQKLADYSVAYIQEAQPASISDPNYIGLLWYQESTGQLRMWNGNSWMPVGFGRLSNDNLRWGGLVDASTGLVTGVTASGTNAGLEIGQPLPEASNALGGLYVVISEAGDKISVTPGQTYDAGDWCLCINEAEGWIRIDTMTGGSGGGGSSTLADLLDVTLTLPTDGQYLQLAPSGQWVNVDLTAAGIGALAPGDNVSELTNDAGYLDEAEVVNILDGKNPDGTPNPGAPDYITSDELTAAIGDGTITIKKADGTEVGSFTVNQDGDTDILLPAETDPTGFVKLNDEGTKQVITGNGGLELDGTGKFTAPYVSVNSDSNFTREGLHVNGDISFNAGGYAFRLYNDDNLDGSGYTYIQRTGTGAFSIAESGGWGQKYYFSASQSFISLSNDNPSGDPDPIPGATAVVHVYNGLNTQFGTSAAPLGNVMPKDDWSSIPALT